MRLDRSHLFIACSIPLLLQTACGGDVAMDAGRPETQTGSVEASVAERRAQAAAQPGAQPSALAAATSASAPPGPPRWNPDAIPASRIEASLERFDNSGQDERSCWTKEEPCDGDLTADLNQRNSGLVGWWHKTGRDVFVDAVDMIRLPPVKGPVTVFVKNHESSKDMVDVVLENRSGGRLYALPPLAVGASATFSWTRTNDHEAGPYRLRLSARTGPGDHTVNYTVLPIVHAQWLAQLREATEHAR